MRTLVKILIAVVVFCVVTAVFVRQVQIAGGRARAALKVEQEAAREVCETIAGLRKNTEGLVKESEARLTVATNALEFVMGSTEHGGLEMIEKKEEEEEEEAEKLKKPKTPSPRPRSAPRPAASPPKRKGFFPEGIMSPRELARRKAIEDGREAPRSVEPGKEEVSESPSRAPAPREISRSAPEEPEIRSLVRGMWRKVAQLRDRADAIRDVELNAAGIRDKVLACERAETAAVKAHPLPERLEAARSVEEEARQLHQEIQGAEEKVAAIRTQVTEDRRRAVEEERKRKEEEEKAALNERERQLVELVRQEGHKKVQQHEYERAEDLARTRLKQLTTEPAREGMTLLVDRFVAMKDLKAFVVSHMAVKKLEWGWGFGPKAVDVLGATDKEIQLKGRRVPWSQVSPAQMLKFVNYYIETVKMRPSKLALRCMEAAVYCDEVALEDKAATYRGRAEDLNQAMKSRLNRLIDEK
ncbi:MAG: hypothetical protein HQ559_12340 [Lentisphaerae bacterium]|nr:hypothetical protein [Lentisphaerota bacterium]